VVGEVQGPVLPGASFSLLEAFAFLFLRTLRVEGLQQPFPDLDQLVRTQHGRVLDHELLRLDPIGGGDFGDGFADDPGLCRVDLTGGEGGGGGGTFLV
jgi:hypothetical protein